MPSGSLMHLVEYEKDCPEINLGISSSSRIISDCPVVGTLDVEKKEMI